MNSYTYTNLQWLSTDTGYNLEDLPEAIDDWDGWNERVRELHAVSLT